MKAGDNGGTETEKGRAMRLPAPRLVTPLATALLLLASGAAAAAPLEPAECKSLQSEHEALLAEGTKRDMAKGPAWAKANLRADRLDKIARLITVEEKLSFRCGQMVTASPQLREPPPEETAKAAPAGKGFSRIPLPIRKSEAAPRQNTQTKNAKKK